MYFRRTLILLFVISLLLSQFTLAKDTKGTDFKKQLRSFQTQFEGYLGSLDIYNRIINYIQKERNVEDKNPIAQDPGASAVLFVADLVLSLFCLWITIFFLTEMKITAIKKYLWFVFIWNVAWVVELLISKGAWGILDFMVIRLRPDLGPVILDRLPIILIVATILMYIWLLARTFSLNFLGALGVFFASHLVYFVIIFIILAATNNPGAERLHTAVKQNLSLQQAARNYILDSQNIARNANILSFVRIKAFHL